MDQAIEIIHSQLDLGLVYLDCLFSFVPVSYGLGGKTCGHLALEKGVVKSSFLYLSIKVLYMFIYTLVCYRESFWDLKTQRHVSYAYEKYNTLKTQICDLLLVKVELVENTQNWDDTS